MSPHCDFTTAILISTLAVGALALPLYAAAASAAGWRATLSRDAV
jgi:hypothetical protein